MFVKDIHYSLDLERAVLGICLLEKTAFSKVFNQLQAEMFYYSSHEEVFKTLAAMYKTGLPINLFTVTDHLIRVRGLRELFGQNTPSFLTKISTDVCQSTHIEYHSFLIKNMWLERELIILTSSGVKQTGDTREKIYKLQQRLQSLNSHGFESEWKDMSQLMVEMYQHQEQMSKREGIGIRSGIFAIDNSNGGFHPGQMIVIGARPSVGKSALMGQMAINMAAKGTKVGIISLEMKDAEIAGRLAAIDTNSDFNVLFRGLYNDQDQRHRIYNRIGKSTAHLPIFVSDKTEANIHEIRAKAVKLQATEGLDLLCIDYLQLVEGTGNTNRNRENEVSEISRGVKIMAKEMNIPVIAICQLNREVTKRKGRDRYPQLGDLRESGSLEQDADIVMFLHRDYMSGIETSEDGRTTEFEADLVVRKWRNGRSNFIIPLDFDPPKMMFRERDSRVFKAAPKNYTEVDKDEPF